MEKIYNIEVCCPNCAAKMETAAGKVEGVSAAVMVVLGLAMKKWKWLGDYALPISLVAGMAAAIPITALLG